MNSIKNKYDEKYDIRLARYDEIDEVMDFIDKYWRKDHILAKNRAFFEYEMTTGDRVNFVIAKDKESNQIHGMHGFLSASNDINPDMWGCIWKVIPGSMGMLGLEIVNRIDRLTGCRNFLTMGANPDTIPLLKIARKFEDVGKMSHFYCLADKDEYNIAIIKHKEAFKENKDNDYEVIEIDNVDILNEKYDFSNEYNVLPKKDAWYYDHRFLKHPLYEYKVYGIEKDNTVKAIFVCRKQEYNNAAALRIVDYNGDPSYFKGINSFLFKQLQIYEYVDFYCYGFDNDEVLKSGMVERYEDDENIIPNYFAPYLAKNIEIYTGTPKGKVLFVKADGDQDRPS